MNATEIPARPTGLLRPMLFVLVVPGLAAAAAGIIALLVVNTTVPDLPANTPAGVVEHYIAAIDEGDYSRAYAFLSDRLPDKPALDVFSRYNAFYGYRSTVEKTVLGNVNISGTTATVMVNYSFEKTGSAKTGENRSEPFSLLLENGIWQINGLAPRYMPWNIYH